MGLIPALKMYIKARREGGVLASEGRFRLLLENLADFMIVHGHRVRERQKLIRNLGVVELLIEVIKSPFAQWNHSGKGIEPRALYRRENESILETIKAAYNVLEMYIHQSGRKNKLYLARHMPFFQSFLG